MGVRAEPLDVLQPSPVDTLGAALLHTGPCGALGSNNALDITGLRYSEASGALYRHDGHGRVFNKRIAIK